GGSTDDNGAKAPCASSRVSGRPLRRLCGVLASASASGSERGITRGSGGAAGFEGAGGGGDVGEADREGGALARGRTDVEVPAHRLGEGLGDREAEAGAPRGPRPGLGAAVEAVEHVRELLGGDPLAVVGD